MAAYQALIIEDDLYSGEILANLLQYQGVAVINLRNYQLALPILSYVQSLDLIFLDLVLGNTSGYQIFDLIRSLTHLTKTPIVAYSAHTNEKAMVRQHGFQGFLSKPISDEMFPKYLAALLRGEMIWD